MDRFIIICFAGVNAMGRQFCDHAAGMFLQIGVLVTLLLLADVLLRKHIRATLRYWLWMLVFVKLLLPPTLCMPTGIGYWRGDLVTLSPAVAPQAAETAPPQAPPERFASVERTSRADWAATGAHPDDIVTTMEPIAAAVPSVHPTWQAAAFLLWATGMLAFAGWVVQRVFFVRRLMARGHPADKSLVDVLEACRLRMGLRARVGLRLTSEASSPAVCGLLRPTILLPVALVDKLMSGGLEAVLIHELAHVKRADLWLNCLQTVLQIIYFYNPLVWLAGAMVRRVREQAVDEMVLVALGAEARSYSRTLVDIAEMAFARVSPALRLIGVAESRKSLEGRIKHMITRPTPRSARVGLRGLLIVVVAGAVLLPMAKAQRENGNPAADGSEGAPSAIQTRPESVAPGETHDVSALPLTDFERSLVAQVVELVKQVEQEYPDQAKHWPAGPALYHVDAQGQVTVWQYQVLTRRSTDGAEDEVGWGSSQAVNASGMYYLPDGTPLSSHWRERGNGMKDIRVKVGHAVSASERVALIHRRGLSGAHDLWSRAGGERTILLDAYPRLPLRIVVRVDKPMRLARWWVGEPIQAEVQNFDNYDRLLVSGPPQENPGPMLVTIQLPPGAAPGPRVEVAPPQADEVATRISSARRLDRLGKAALIYANDHGNRLPEGMENLREELKPDDLEWLRQNVTYLGRGLSAASSLPSQVVAYDKTILALGHGTNVLYLDAHVVFEKPEDLQKLGIQPVVPRETERAAVMTHLKRFALAMMLYAEDHQGTYAPSIQEAKPYFAGADEFTWAVGNIGYLGAGVQRSTVTSFATRPLAYWKTVPPAEEGTVVAFFDGHVEFVKRDKLAELGIR
jgi:prepilin-type processing-associated H-X9-DG protein